jgi:hypothetical protein
MLQGFAFGVVGDFQQRLELLPLRHAEIRQYEVLPQLQADDSGLGVQCELGHGRGNKGR